MRETFASLIRMGIGITKPLVEATISEDGKSACAWGAAMIAAQHLGCYVEMFCTHPRLRTPVPTFMYRPLTVKGDKTVFTDVIVHLNDVLGIDRRYIADFVQGLEEGEAMIQGGVAQSRAPHMEVVAQG